MLLRALVWFAARASRRTVLSGNDSCYRSHLWRDTGAELNISPKRTRAYRPRPTARSERFHCTKAEGWAFKRFYNSDIRPPSDSATLDRRGPTTKGSTAQLSVNAHRPRHQPALSNYSGRDEGPSYRGGVSVSPTLPVEVTPFVGRRRQLAEVRRWLSSNRLVTLTGPGGVGKTRLALRVAVDVRRAFPDGVYLAELAGVKEPRLLEHALGSALGLRDHAPTARIDACLDYLRSKTILLILDNCEHMVDECSILVGQLLRSCPNLRILATSQAPLRVGGEAVFPVPPLSTPDLDSAVGSQALEQYEAVRLLLDRARGSIPGFTITDENAADVAAMCRKLEGLPLALELAAVRLRSLSPAEIVERLDRRVELLTQGDRSAPARQHTLKASMDWTLEMCTPQERTLWGRLSTFNGGFELDAAEGVCWGSEGVPRERVLEVVAALVDKSLLVAEQAVSPVRYRMLETIRQYGQDLLTSAQLADVRRLHRDWYARLAARAEHDWLSARQPAWLARLVREHANLQSALEFSVDDREEATIGLRMAVRLEQYWIVTGELAEGRHWLNRALAFGVGTDPEKARALRLNAWLALLQNDSEDATRLLKEAERLSADDDVARAYVRQTSGMLAIFHGDLAAGLQELERALLMFQVANHPLGEIKTLFQIGMTLGLNGQMERATSALRECLALTKLSGEFDSRADCLWALGLDALSVGDLLQATELEQESLRLKRELDDRLGIALCLEALAWVAAAQSAPERAGFLLGGADSVWQKIRMSIADFPFLEGYRADAVASGRASLGQESFSAAVRRGRGLSLGDALAVALMEDAAATEVSLEICAPELTRREREVAELLAQGVTNKEIAARLVISQRTAESHVGNILVKLGFSSRAQIAAWMVGQQREHGSSGPPHT